MIPVSADGWAFAEEAVIPGKTYRIDRAERRLDGMVDGLEAVQQAIALRLGIQRGRHAIYSWAYGMVLEDLFGMPTAYVQSELKRRITETLLQDDRITAVEDFSFENRRGKLLVRFMAQTIYGDLEQESEFDR